MYSVPPYTHTLTPFPTHSSHPLPTTLTHIHLPTDKADQQSKASTPSGTTDRPLLPPSTSGDQAVTTHPDPMDTSGTPGGGGALTQVKIQAGGVSVQGSPIEVPPMAPVSQRLVIYCIYLTRISV